MDPDYSWHPRTHGPTFKQQVRRARHAGLIPLPPMPKPRADHPVQTVAN